MTCALVDLLRVDDDLVVRTALVYEDPRIADILRPTQWVRSESRDLSLCALSTGEAGFHANIDDAWYQQIAVNEGHLEILRSLGFCSMLTVPMRFAGELLGALTLFFRRSGRQFDRLVQDDEAIPTPGHTPTCMSYQVGDASSPAGRSS